MSALAQSSLPVAAVQLRSHPGDEQRNLRSAAQWTCRAAERGVRLVVFPELMVSGYQRQAATAVTRAGTLQALDALAGMARGAGVWLLAPLAERDEAGGLYNSAALFSDDGALMAMKRKRALWGWEPEVFTPGEEPLSATVDSVPIGVLLCYEVEFPEPARALVLAGAELLLLPAAWSTAAGWRWQLQPAARALDNVCYLLRVNGVGAGLCGRSAFIGPDGRELAALGDDEEGLVVGSYRRDELERWRSELPYLEDLRTVLGRSLATGGG